MRAYAFMHFEIKIHNKTDGTLFFMAKYVISVVKIITVKITKLFIQTIK